MMSGSRKREESGSEAAGRHRRFRDASICSDPVDTVEREVGVDGPGDGERTASPHLAMHLGSVVSWLLLSR
jgi:hypothetical protein